MTPRARGGLVPSIALSAALALGGCESLFGDSGPPPLPGQRIAILDRSVGLEPDPTVAATPITLPEPVTAPWPLPGGSATNAPGHLTLAADPRQVWRVDIGSGSSGTLALLAPPVVADGRVVAMDGAAQVSAFDAATGNRLWTVDARDPVERGDARGGGVAIAGDIVVASTGYGEVLGLDVATGAERWRHRAPAPGLSAPTVFNNRAYISTIDNQLIALSVADGSRQWTHVGIFEPASMLGRGVPAVDAGLLVVPFSSGEVVALRVENGRQLWSDSLASVRTAGALNALPTILGNPVITRGVVVVSGHGGRLVGIDARSGQRAWDHDVGGQTTPWVAGDTVYLVTLDSRLAALTARQGRVRWVEQLAQFRRPDRRTDPIDWTGPVLAGGRLWLANTEAQLVAIDPTNGRTLATYPLPDAARLAPVVANGTLYVLTEDGSLTAFR